MLTCFFFSFDPVLRNPLYFIFLLLLAAAAYVTYTLNLWGPMIKMANAASAQALEEGKKRLRDFLESSDAGRQAMAMSSSESARHDGDAGYGYEMKRMNGRAGVKAKMDGGVSEDEGLGGEGGDL